MLLLFSGVTDFKAVKDSSTSDAPSNSSSLPLIISSVCGLFIICASTLCIVITCRRKVLDEAFHFGNGNSSWRSFLFQCKVCRKGRNHSEIWFFNKDDYCRKQDQTETKSCYLKLQKVHRMSTETRNSITDPIQTWFLSRIVRFEGILSLLYKF